MASIPGNRSLNCRLGIDAWKFNVLLNLLTYLELQASVNARCRMANDIAKAIGKIVFKGKVANPGEAVRDFIKKYHEYILIALKREYTTYFYTLIY